MKFRQGQVAVVTGAGSGLGRALSLQLASRGLHLALVDFNEKALIQVEAEVRQYGFPVSRHTVDVSNREQMEKLPEEVIQVHGKVNLLINNAGVILTGKVEEQKVEDFEWIVGINFWGVVYGCRYFLPLLQGGSEAHIVNISSMLAFVGLPNQALYCATKAAVQGFSEALYAECAAREIQLTIAHPGGIRTNLMKKSRTTDESHRDQVDAMVQRFAMTPDRVATRVLSAVQKNRPRVVISIEAKLTGWAKRILPNGILRMAAWQFRKMNSLENSL